MWIWDLFTGVAIWWAFKCSFFIGLLYVLSRYWERRAAEYKRKYFTTRMRLYDIRISAIGCHEDLIDKIDHALERK